MSQSGDRLKQLEEIEKDVVKVIRSAGETLEELSKDNPSEDRINSTATKFLKSLEGVEKGLTEQIGYLTKVATGQPHEGSIYGAEKNFELLRCWTKSVKDQLVEIRDEGAHDSSKWAEYFEMKDHQNLQDRSACLKSDCFDISSSEEQHQK